MNNQKPPIVKKKCLFCEKTQSEVKILIVPGKENAAGICDSCVKICLDVMYEKHMEEVAKSISLTEKHDVKVLKDDTELAKPEAT